jgi:hypothetical protein
MKKQNSPCSYNNNWPDNRPPRFEGFYERSMTPEKANNLDGYLEQLGDYFSHIQVVPTIGGIPLRREYPFQWIAYSVTFQGFDDPFEGLGKSPLEAIRNLYNEIRSFDWEDEPAPVSGDGKTAEQLDDNCWCHHSRHKNDGTCEYPYCHATPVTRQGEADHASL